MHERERERVRRSELECESGVVSERVWTSGLARFRVSQCATGDRSLGAENVDTLRQFLVSRFFLSFCPLRWLLRETPRGTRTRVARTYSEANGEHRFFFFFFSKVVTCEPIDFVRWPRSNRPSSV